MDRRARGEFGMECSHHVAAFHAMLRLVEDDIAALRNFPTNAQAGRAAAAVSCLASNSPGSVAGMVLDRTSAVKQPVAQQVALPHRAELTFSRSAARPTAPTTTLSPIT